MATFMETTEVKPNNHAATATLFVNGRALLCFSKKNERAEVGFLKIRRHDLLFTIYNASCDPVFGTPFDLSPRTIIAVNSNNNGLGKLYYPPLETSIDEDFRHLLDLDRIHKWFDFDERLNIKNDNDYLAELYIKNGIFFNAALSTRIGRVFPIGDPRQTVIRPRRIGKVIGTELNDDLVIIEISGKEPIHLRREEGPFSIVIRYKCINERPSIATDFQEFYSALKEFPSRKHDRCDLEYDDVEQPYKHPCEKPLPARFEKDENFRESVIKNESFQKLLDSIILAEEACQAVTKTECPENLVGDPEQCPPVS